MNNNDVFNNMYKEFNEKRLSHIFLIVTDDINRCYQDINKFVKKISCPKMYSVDCTEKCNICRQIDNQELTDIKIIKPENNFIKKDVIRDLINDFTITSKYIKNKIYIILEADKINQNSSNTLLKFIEEPQENIIGFLVTKNKSQIIPTILSRCVLYNIYYDDTTNQIPDGEKEDINSLVQLTNDKIEKNISLEELLIFKLKLIKTLDNKEKLLYFFNELLKINNQLLTNKEKKLDILVKRLKIIDNISRSVEFNANVELMFDKFFIEMVSI